MKKQNIFLLSLLFISFHVRAVNEPLSILLTWTEDPTTTISVDWHNMESQPQTLYYREKGESQWQSKKSKFHPFPFSDRMIHRVAINKLKPGTSYQLKFGEYPKEYYFNTMPENTIDEPVRIAIGGDAMHEKAYLEKTNTEAAKYEPHFVVIGGDMAYENGDSARVDRMYDFLDGVKNTLITGDNRIIPIVVGLGNHEVQGGYYNPETFSGNDADREKHSPYFYSIFAFPSHPGYNILDFGNYLSLFMLDTDHNSPIVGEQTDWLESELKKRSDKFLHIVPVYHVTAYPSVRDFDAARSVAIRENWLPLFEEHNVKIAFENHDHAYKRTYPIKGNKIDENGIVFIGDGNWGTRSREHRNVEETWYLKKAMSERHFILLTIQGRHHHLIMVNEDGEVIDSYPEIYQTGETPVQIETTVR
jgi:acid phosphatase type 7